MSEPTKYPPAFGVLTSDGKWELFSSSPFSDDDIVDDEVEVQLIPAQDVERRIAEEVAAERERCRQLADKMCDLLAFQELPERVYQMIHDQYDAIESGSEPEEGGAP